MDAVGSERAVLFGLGDASPLSVLFAATYPERTAGLILVNASPRFVKSPGLPWLPTREETRRGGGHGRRRLLRLLRRAGQRFAARVPSPR
jgi:pimeloyl-ACP methyl ester carboxylesterase